MTKILSFFAIVALLTCFSLSTATAKSVQPNTATIEFYAPVPDPDKDTLAVMDVSYTLNYKQFNLSFAMIPKPLLVLADGTVKTETDFTIIEYSLVSSTGPWNNAITNPDPIPFGSGTAYIYWQVKYNGEWYTTKGGKAQKVSMSYPPCDATLAPMDGDGNIYQVVSVAGNCWTKTNLKTKKYAVNVKDFSAGDAARKAMVYSADGNSDTNDNKNRYGYLYTWYSAMGLTEESTETPQISAWGNVVGICPTGWNIPNADDYRALFGLDAGKLRSNSNWITNPGSNTTKMTIEPGGYYNSEANNCVDLKSTAYFLTSETVAPGSSQVRCFMADCFCHMIREVILDKGSATSVRCVKEMEKKAPVFQSLDLYTYQLNILAYASFSSVGTNMDHYKFCIATNKGMTENLQCYDNVDKSYYLFTGLTPCTWYYVQVTGYNEIGSAISTVDSIRVNNPVVPELTTGTATNITYNSAELTNNITFDGGESVTGRGVCWSISPTPTLSDNYTSDGTGDGSYTSSVTGLAASTTYYVRAYATNSIGTAYGNEISFTTCYADTITFMRNGGTGGPIGKMIVSRNAVLVPATHDDNWSFIGWNDKFDGKGNVVNIANGNDTLYAQWHTWCNGTAITGEMGSAGRVDSVKDYEGNWYKVVRIGNQCWLKENIKSMRYSNGTYIPSRNSSSTSSTTAYRYFPNDDSSFVKTCGYHYNWPAVMNGQASSSSNPSGVQGICPEGWHVPSYDEWYQLTNYLNSQSQYVCGDHSDFIAKALASTYYWAKTYDHSPCEVGYDLTTNNTTGFSAIPDLISENVGNGVVFWTSSQFVNAGDDNYAFYRQMVYHWQGLGLSFGRKHMINSVRCVRD